MMTTDSRTEQFLTWLGLKWEYVNDVTFYQLVNGWETNNLGRSKDRVDSAVKEYKALMESGSPAPAPMIWFDPKLDAFVVLDGVQRLLAEKDCGSTSFSAYVVKTTSRKAVKKVRVASNPRLQGGHQDNPEWTLCNIVRELTDSGCSTKEIAALCGWAPSVVADKQAVQKTQRLITECGGPEDFPDTILRVFGQHVREVDFQVAAAPVKEFCVLIKQTQFSAEDAEPWIEAFFDVPRSSRGKLHDRFKKELKAFEENPEIQLRIQDPKRHRKAQLTPDGRLNKAISGCLTTVRRINKKHEIIYDNITEHCRTLNEIKKILKMIEAYSRKGK